MRSVNLQALIGSPAPHESLAGLQRKKKPSNGAPARPLPFPPGTSGSGGDGVLFTGNPHETTPRRLLLDNRLTPLERNAWQVLRLLIDSKGLASPTYEQLRSYLTNQPFRLASRETVSRALVILRMTRWISQIGPASTARSDAGQMRGSIYLLHDAPIGVDEATLMDRSYIELVRQSLSHSNRSISEVAAHVHSEIEIAREEPSHLDRMSRRLLEQGWATRTPEYGIRTEPGEPPSTESELGKNHSVRNFEESRSDSVLSVKSSTYTPVRNPNPYSTKLFTNTSVCKSFVQDATAPGGQPGSGPDTRPPQADSTAPATGLQLPALMETLPPDHRQNALITLQRIEPAIRQALLDQWAERCSRQTVRSPVRYLFALMHKARRGEFNAQAVARTSPAPQAPVTASAPLPVPAGQGPTRIAAGGPGASGAASRTQPTPAVATPPDRHTPENVAAKQRCMAELRRLFKPWRYGPGAPDTNTPRTEDACR